MSSYNEYKKNALQDPKEKAEYDALQPETNIISDEAYSHLLQNIGTALTDGRRKAVTQVNQTLVETNWNIGRILLNMSNPGTSRLNMGLKH